tara:strand:+ start:28 stop:138 length:111 start_codon:yes stop_codon:yes gene_type:complete
MKFRWTNNKNKNRFSKSGTAKNKRLAKKKKRSKKKK